MAQNPRGKSVEVDIPQLLRRAQDKSGIPLFANHVQFSFGMQEIALDFYLLGTDTKEQGKPQAVFLQRIIIPLWLSKGFANAMANLIRRFEKDTGTTIPNSRERQPDDLVDIWETK